MSDTSFYTEEDLMVIFKIEGEDMKPDFIDAYLSQSMSPNNISIDSENYWLLYFITIKLIKF